MRFFLQSSAVSTKQRHVLIDSKYSHYLPVRWQVAQEQPQFHIIQHERWWQLAIKDWDLEKFRLYKLVAVATMNVLLTVSSALQDGAIIQYVFRRAECVDWVSSESVHNLWANDDRNMEIIIVWTFGNRLQLRAPMNEDQQENHSHATMHLYS